MANDSSDLHGMVPDKSPVALILLDVINDLEFEGGELLIAHALPMARKLAVLKAHARRRGIPVVYVNDNYGRWQSDFNKLIGRCLDEDVRGRPVVDLLRPEENDYFVLKPKHSGFFSTTLDVLLDALGAKTLIVTGLAGNICVLFTANDAYMRDFRLVVPADCVASNDPEDNRYALRQMQQTLKADITASDALDLDRLLREAGGDQPNPHGETQQFAHKSQPG